MDFNEDFLHFIWRFRLFNSVRLVCAEGEELQVLHPGNLNQHAGPDFTEARLLIDQTSWVGHVEVHLKSSDWLQHGHQHNAFYDGVILHVVYRHDCPVYRSNGTLVPVLVLEGILSESLLDRYQSLLANTNRFPCEKHVWTLDQLHIQSFLSRLLVERFELKSKEVFEQLDHNCGNWEQVFYLFMARSFGLKVNAVPFELLATALPLHILSKHKDNALQIEALLFGQAGFLEQQFTEAYPLQLQAEYTFLRKKYKLSPIHRSLWKFLRMRPQNFPTVRIARFAALIVKSDHLFSKVIHTGELPALYALFEQLPVNQYWLNHYHFHKKAEGVKLLPGKSTIAHILINSVCLFLCCYGKYTGRPELTERAMDFLGQLPAEHNAVVKSYRLAGVEVGNAFISQALLHLNKYYCNEKKCLNCSLGLKILRK